jgi:putative ABC transport system permease protein
MTSVSFLIRDLFETPLTLACFSFCVVILALAVVFLINNPKLFLLIFKNLRRNKLRTLLTCMAIMVLVVVITGISTIVFFLDRITQEKSSDLKAIITERWQFPSALPPTYGQALDPDHPSGMLPEMKGLVKPGDFMAWYFYGGTIDPGKMTRENLIFFFTMEPRHVKAMMDDLQDLDDGLIAQLEKNPKTCVIGREKLQSLNKRVGETITITSMNFKDINLELKIIGLLPEGRYNQSAIMNVAYLKQALDDYERQKKTRHPMADKALALIWLRVRDKATFERVAEITESHPKFTNPQVKCETASSGIASFIEPYKDLIWGMKYILVPAILISMTLVVANTISISVRERRAEMAVMKVLGYRPRQILMLVVGEALLVGGLSGFLAGFLFFALIDFVVGGVKFPVAFFPTFLIPINAVLWGLTMGFFTSLFGSLMPAWTARNIKVSEVFSKVA